MSIRIYNPVDSITFGQYEGTPLSKVFKYHPHYVEWAIIKIPEFAIDMEAFEKLPKPTPVHLKGAYEQENGFVKFIIEKYNVQPYSKDDKDGNKFPYFSGNEFLSLIEEFIRDKGYKPEQYDFKFTSNTKKINEDKCNEAGEDDEEPEPYYEEPDYDYEREYFNTMTDGQLGDYDDFRERGGDLDKVDDWSGK